MSLNKNQHRRSFIKGLATLGAGALGLGTASAVGSKNTREDKSSTLPVRLKPASRTVPYREDARS